MALNDICLAPDIIARYPRVVLAIFHSTTDTVDAFNYNHVTNAPNGYVDEIEKCAQSSDRMGDSSLVANPYSTRLMPVTPLDTIFNAPEAMLEKMLFVAYDGTRIGSPHQNAANNTVIDTSQASTLDAYMASHFRAGIIGNHQPNFFRPTVRINGKSVLGNLEDSYVEPRGHLAHMSIGLPLPFEANWYAIFPNVQSIDVYAGAGQWITTSAEPTNKLVRYPVLCVQQWRVVD